MSRTVAGAGASSRGRSGLSYSHRHRLCHLTLQPESAAVSDSGSGSNFRISDGDRFPDPVAVSVTASVSPHFSPEFVARAARRNTQLGSRPEGRGAVPRGTLSTPRRENTAGGGTSQAAAEGW
jgi:hypothetical protein